MSDENTAPDGANSGDGQEPKDQPLVPRSELEKAIEKRQRKAKELEGTRDELSKALAQIEAYKVRDKEAEEAALRQQGENEKIIAEREEQIAARDKQIADMIRKDRFGKTAQAVSAELGLDLVITRGLLREAEQAGADVAPEKLDDDGVAQLVGAIRKMAPSLTQAKTVGGTPGVAGLNMANKNAGEETASAAKARVMQLAKDLSHKPSPTG